MRVCVCVSVHNMSPIQISFESKWDIEKNPEKKESSDRVSVRELWPWCDQSNIECVYMQIYDIIFLVWSLWVGIFEHQAFKK